MEDMEKVKELFKAIAEKTKAVEVLHEQSKDALDNAKNAESHEGRSSAALVAIAEALIVNNQIQLIGTSDLQMKLAMEALEEL